MATNFIQRGENLTIPAPAIAVNGEPVFAGEIRGIAMHSAAADMPLVIATTGVWELPKVAIDDVDLGDPIYWDDAAKLATVDDVSGANPEIGVAVAGAGASTGTVNIRLSF